MPERLRIVKNVLGIALALASGGSGVQYSRYHNPNSCEPQIWTHVYSPDRLYVIDPCVTLTGTVISINDEADGDSHVLLVPDPEYKDIINDYRFRINERDQKSALVTEPIPVDGIRQDFGLKVGQHVRMTGAYVSDLWHDGWLEIHPITSVEILEK